jgi:hypothetical protein
MSEKLFNSMIDLFGIEKEGMISGLVMKWFNEKYNQKVKRFRIERFS